MSYILDALKRADAERGLTADAAITDTQPLTHAHRTPAPWWRSGTGVLALAAALLGLAGLAVLWWPQAKTPSPNATPEPTPEVAAPVSLAVPQPTPIAPAAPPPAPAPAAPAGTPPAEALNAATDNPGLPAPILLPERPVVARPAGAATGPAFGPDPVPPPPGVAARPTAPTPPPPAQVAAAPSAPVASAAPASAPPVKVTGATYSDNPAHRMLIVNGKIVMEGQDIEPGLKLEVITPHSAVLNHQGSRFNINY